MAIYYVDYTTGNDDDTGLTEALAWKTIAKVNASSFSGDDQILFKRGETWREQLKPISSGTSGHPIIFDAYGTGADPIINGSYLNTSWTQYSGNIYYCTPSVQSDPTKVWWNGTRRLIRGACVCNAMRAASS